MPHDPELVAEARAWLLKASRDLAAAAHEFKAEPPFLEDIVFHAQQAAEALSRATDVLNAILVRLPPEVRS